MTPREAHRSDANRGEANRELRSRQKAALDTPTGLTPQATRDVSGRAATRFSPMSSRSI